MIFTLETLEETLFDSGAIVRGGNWPQRHLHKLINARGQDAADSGYDAVWDDEVRSPARLMSTLVASKLVTGAAIAGVMRYIMLKNGLTTEALPTLHQLGQDRQFLMTPVERQLLACLGDNVIVYRGQPYRDGHGIMGLSWSICFEVAETFATSTDSLPHGWVFTATVPRQAIVCFLEERGEDELIIAPADVHSWTKEQFRPGDCPAPMALIDQIG